MNILATKYADLVENVTQLNYEWVNHSFLNQENSLLCLLSDVRHGQMELWE